MTPDVVSVMSTRRRAFRQGTMPPRHPYSEHLNMPGYRPDEIERIARKIRGRILAWRKRRA